MERERYSDEDQAEREIEEQTEGNEAGDDSELERRAGFKPAHEVNPEPPRERAQAVYGDTDMNPNADDQRSAHRAEPDEHL